MVDRKVHLLGSLMASTKELPRVQTKELPRVQAKDLSWDERTELSLGYQKAIQSETNSAIHLAVLMDYLRAKPMGKTTGFRMEHLSERHLENT